MSELIAEADVAALEKGYGLYPANVERLCAAWREQQALLERIYRSECTRPDIMPTQLLLDLEAVLPRPAPRSAPPS